MPKLKTSERTSSGLPCRLFRRHVAGRTQNDAGDGLATVCVRSSGSSVVGRSSLARPKSRSLTVPSRVIKHVGRLQIAVQDAAIVSRFQRARDLDRQPDRFGRRDRTAQRLAVDVLEHEIARPDVVQLADVRMVQGRDRPRFVFESAQAIRVMRPPAPGEL